MPDNSTAAKDLRKMTAMYRERYGFGQCIVCCILLFLYLVWVYILCPFQIGLTYWPQKYWVDAIPAYIVTAVLMVEFIIYPHLNVLLTSGLDDTRVFTDKHAIYQTGPGIAPVSDILLSESSKRLHM